MSWDDQDENNPWGKKRPQNSQQSSLDDMIRSLKKYLLTQKFSNGGGGGYGGGHGAVKLFMGLTVLVFAGWLISGFYVIDTDQKGVVLRFGEYVRLSDSGLHYKWPSPIEIVYKPHVQKVNIIESGTTIAPSTKTSDALDDRVMLTGDENIVNISFIVQWKIKDARDFVLNTRYPEMTLKITAESVIREVIGQTPILPIVSGSGWEPISSKAQTLLQNLSDEYKLGIEIINIVLQKASPPEAVNEAFQDVQNARTDKARLSNEAEAYRNDILPRARAEVIQITRDAEAYKQALVVEAQGEAKRFTAVFEEYQKNPEVTLKRMQLTNMKRVFENEKNSKVFIDPRLNQQLLQVLPGAQKVETK